MRNKLKIIITLVLLLMVWGCAGTSSSEKQVTPPPTAPADATKPVPPEDFKNLSFIKMFNESTGWSISPTAVIRMESGKWIDVSPKEPSGAGFNQAAFIDANTGWLSTSKSGATNITILRTKDGGKTWLTTDIASTEPGAAPTVKTIDFVDDTHGWLAVSYGVGAGSELVEVYQTTNGGETWTLIASPRKQSPNGIPGGGLKTGLSFIDANRGWLTGLWYGDTVWLYRSDDSGKTWKKQMIKVPPGYPTQGGAVETQAPMFFNNNTGVLPLVFHSQGQPVIFYLTEDKGSTWVASTPIKSNNDEAFIWSFANSKEGMATDHAQIYATIDSAKSWKTVKPNMDFKAVTQIDFISSKIGWAIGKDLFVKTTDGGLTWTPAS